VLPFLSKIFLAMFSASVDILILCSKFFQKESVLVCGKGIKPASYNEQKGRIPERR